MFKVNDYEQSTNAYLKEIGDFKPLTKPVEMELWERLKVDPNDTMARDKLLTSNLKFVVNVASHYKGRGLSMSDLVAEGNVGLLKAYKKFDPAYNVKFISYSVHWIRQSILEAIEKRNGIHGDELPMDYESQTDGVDEDYLEADNTPELLNKFSEADGDTEYERNLQQKEALMELFKGLNDRELFIIKAYFGLETGKPQTLEEIGCSLNLTKERVRPIKECGMKKMRSEAIANPSVLNIYKEYVVTRE